MAVVLTTAALFSAARPAAMLNYTSGPDAVVSAIATEAIRTVDCTHAYVEKADLQDLVERIRTADAKVV